MFGILHDLKSSAREAARRAMLSVIGIVFMAVGTGFLTVALWMVIAAQYNALIAFEVLGGLYLVLGLIFLLVRPSASSHSSRAESRDHSRSPEPSHSPNPVDHDPFVQVAEGFARGLQAGKAARQARD